MATCWPRKRRCGLNGSVAALWREHADELAILDRKSNNGQNHQAAALDRRRVRS
jgi:hypothetical protein